jgi:ABC-2 type transport system ATP-binding protein
VDDDRRGGLEFRAEDVSKVYDGTNRANDGITLQVEPGEVYELLGPNGAGKSILVKQMIRLLKPTGGRITLGPYDLVADPDAARQLCPGRPQRGTGERPDPVVAYTRRRGGGRMGHDRVGHRASTLKTTSNTRFNHEAWMGHGSL